MKIFGKHILILGGFYFIISFLLGLGESDFLQIVESIIICLFVVMFLVLCFKRKFTAFESFEQKFPKITNFVLAFGVLEYIGIVFGFIPGFIEGYNVSKAAYHQTEYEPIFSTYMIYFTYVYAVFTIVALVWATYQSFRQKSNNLPIK